MKGLPESGGFVCACLFILLATGFFVHAGEIEVNRATSRNPAEIYHRGQWEFGLESLYTFVVVPNPFFGMAGYYNKNPLQYSLATQLLSLRYQLTDPAGPLFLRGSLELNATVVGTTILRGPETYFIGFAVGWRYYFIQPGARLVPYVEARLGPGQTDAAGFRFAQQQDLTGVYLLGIGVRYDVSPRWSVTLSAVDQHLSNAYLTRPNYGFDSVGINLGVIARF
jgi:hypothetical protein